MIRRALFLFVFCVSFFFFFSANVLGKVFPPGSPALKLFSA